MRCVFLSLLPISNEAKTMCRWSKEELKTREIRDNIPLRDLRKCGEDITTRDSTIRLNPAYRSTPKREVIPLSEQRPAPAPTPRQPIATAQPPGSAWVGLVMLGAGIGLLGWLIRSALHPKSNHRPAHQNPTE